MKCHNNKLNLFNQVSLINISCFGNIHGYEDKYLQELIYINPSEAILMNRTFKTNSDIHQSNFENPYHSILKFR